MAGKPASDLEGLRALLGEVKALRQDVERKGAELRSEWGVAGDKATPRVINLSHYLAMREQDLTDLQYRLAARGLSSLGRSESHVALALDTLIVTLKRLTGKSGAAYPAPASARAGAAELEAEANRLFGKRQKGGPRARVMATLPPEAASQPEFVDNLVAAGMDCARINCAHDDPEMWGRMVGHVREAAAPARASLPGDDGYRRPEVPHPQSEGAAEDPNSCAATGSRWSTNCAKRRRSRSRSRSIFLNSSTSSPSARNCSSTTARLRREFVSKAAGRAEIEVYAAREKGVRLKPGKGVNFPSTELDLPPLTSKDFRDLDFIAEHADLIGFSFVQRADDVELLQDHLVARAPKRQPHGLVLKIETPLAVRNLPRLILQSAAHNPTAVMIARGDLAVELGFARLTEMQEEILWLCEAAHTPVVWATQVLDSYVRDGVASRAEMTDAAMAQGAECVMLNKGPYLGEGVAFLRDVLARMDRHRAKKFARFASLKEWA